MSNYHGTAAGVADILEQIVRNLDAQVEQLTASATVADAESAELAASSQYVIYPRNRRRELREAFAEIARARAHLVNAHGEIMGTVPSYLTREEPIR